MPRTINVFYILQQLWYFEIRCPLILGQLCCIINKLNYLIFKTKKHNSMNEKNSKDFSWIRFLQRVFDRRSFRINLSWYQYFTGTYNVLLPSLELTSKIMKLFETCRHYRESITRMDRLCDETLLKLIHNRDRF